MRLRVNKKYIKTNSRSNFVKRVDGFKINRTAVIINISYKNMDRFLIKNDFLIEAAKDGFLIKENTLGTTLAYLSGHDSQVKSSKQRNALIREDISEEDYLEFGWSRINKHKYRYNPAGNTVSRGALLPSSSDNITTASLVA